MLEQLYFLSKILTISKKPATPINGENRRAGKMYEMSKSILKIAAATALIAGIHSLLGSRAAKEKASKLFGERMRNGIYRPLYNGLAIVTFGALGLYGLNLPDRELYRVRGPFSRLMHSVQFFFLLYLLYGAREIGFLRFSGVPNLVGLITGQPFIPIEPEGQGPTLKNSRGMKVTGPFRLSRHPLNFGMIPIIWLMPRMTVNLAGFNLITTLYLILGSVHEEKRLVETYGQAYIDYQKSEINFFLPSVAHSIGTNKKIVG